MRKEAYISAAAIGILGIGLGIGFVRDRLTDRCLYRVLGPTAAEPAAFAQCHPGIGGTHKLGSWTRSVDLRGFNRVIGEDWGGSTAWMAKIDPH